MNETKPMFEFDFRIAEKDSSGYYHTRWDQAHKVTVLGTTKREAFNKAVTMLGEPNSGRGWHWVAECDQIREVVR